ncbi:AAA family ATPase [Capnocytophaga canimorsus]|uniref:AAA family ATPase n=1 Tax=Capnocytophaga canimorsus TaxID=28188 RepID=UPI003858A181
MIKNSPFLFIRQLVVRDYNNKIVYRESFHSGVNIIRGKNSSGKSTISNFIFYILGGAFNNWTSEANKCSDVTAEVLINGSIYTLKREIGDSNYSPLHIFWGDYESSKNDSINWKVFPYKQTENVISFTNVLFDALNFPEVKGDLDSNITIHQILRLIYIDQETPPQSLFRLENFDSPLTRKTVSEILLGIYDNLLYSDRILLRNTKKDLELKEREYKNLVNIVSHSGLSANRGTIEKRLNDEKEELERTNQEIQKLRSTNLIKTNKRTETNIEKIKFELSTKKAEVNNVISKINQYDIEVTDSKQFITTLEKRINELNNSIMTRQLVGDLVLTHCPQCLGELSNDIGESHCKLCKQPIEEETEKANARRLLQEMQLQVKESRKLLQQKEKEYSELKGKLPSLLEKMRFLQKELDLSIENPQSTRDERIDKLLISKGFTESRIENISRQIKMVELIELLSSEISELTAKIKLLSLNISEKEKDQQEKKFLVMSKIKEITLNILKKDLPRQDEFKKGKIVEIDFLRDTFSLDGSNNFSASSKTYFKNAVLFSIFFSSLEFDFMRYPRFILCDNMEDKGMEKERTQNFQEIITEISNEYLKKRKDHQIIFTTSMVSDKLNNTDICVGDYYTENNKTLKL